MYSNVLVYHRKMAPQKHETCNNVEKELPEYVLGQPITDTSKQTCFNAHTYIYLYSQISLKTLNFVLQAADSRQTFHTHKNI